MASSAKVFSLSRAAWKLARCYSQPATGVSYECISIFTSLANKTVGALPPITLQPVGFIGLGNMGLPMAQNLVTRGHQLVLYDISPGRVEKVGGGEGVESPAEVARRAQTVITMLPSGKNVTECYAGEGGILR